MKIKYAFQFDAGEIQIPGERNVQGSGLFPLISHLTDPVEHLQDKLETERMVAEIQMWMRSLAIGNKSLHGLAGEIIRANEVGLWVPGVAALGNQYSLLAYKFFVTFWILDDFLDFYLDNPADFVDDPSNSRMLLCSTMESIWKSPDGVPAIELRGRSGFSSSQVILAAWQSLMKDVQEAVPSYIYHDGFIQELHKLFSDISWIGNGNKVKATSEFAYRIVRGNTSFLCGIWEFISAIGNISIGAHVRNHRNFLSMLSAFADVYAFENDVMSLNKEIVAGESFNLVLVKVNKEHQRWRR